MFVGADAHIGPGNICAGGEMRADVGIGPYGVIVGDLSIKSLPFPGGF